MNFKLERTLVIIGAIVIIALAMGLPFLARPSEDLLPNFALSQLAFSAVAFFIIFLALYFTIVQLRKSMAKPKLEVIFTKTYKKEFSIDIPKGKEVEHKLELSVINRGNAITNCFQIDLILPVLFSPTIATTAVFLNHQNAPLIPHPDINDNYRLIPFLSNKNDYCFVNLPLPIYTISIRTRAEKYSEYKDFNIKYRVYGDWAETQEGTLKVKLIKHKEVSNAAG